MKTYVLYHAGCWDGFCAAWVARKSLGTEGVEYIPVHYKQPLPKMEPASTVYILDFSYPRDVMWPLIRKMGTVVVLDHHQTAEKELEGLEAEVADYGKKHGPDSVADVVHICFASAKSGARLTWEHFFGGKESPWLVDYTEDRDLWRHKLNETKEINAWLRSHPLDFELWDKFADFGPGWERWGWAIDEGIGILRREKQIVDTHVRHAREITMAGHKVLVVNATVLASEIGSELAKGRPFSATYFDRRDGKRQWSLRSEPGGVDVAEIAKSFGGGGHANAAGFEERLMPWELDPERHKTRYATAAGTPV